jgi:hypothetical protein
MRVLGPAMALLIAAGVACSGGSTPSKVVPSQGFVKSVDPGPSDSLPTGRAGFKGSIGAEPLCSFATPACGAAGFVLSADLTFTDASSPSAVRRTHAGSNGAFSLELPPGRYVMRILRASGPAKVDLRCPGPRSLLAKSGKYVLVSVTCVFTP